MEYDLDAHFVTRKGSFTVTEETASDPRTLAFAIATQSPDNSKLSSVRVPGGWRYTWRVIRVVMTRK